MSSKDRKPPMPQLSSMPMGTLPVNPALPAGVFRNVIQSSLEAGDSCGLNISATVSLPSNFPSSLRMLARTLRTSSSESGTREVIIARLLPELAAPEILTGFDAEGKPVTTPAKNRITLRQMLTHTAGMTYEFMDPLLSTWRKTPEGSRAHDDAFVGAYLMPLVYEPGTSWRYSMGIDWAGKLVERANGGVALEAYMQQYIWGPLNMQDITFHLEKNARVAQRRVEMTARVPDSELLVLDTTKNMFAPDVVSYASGGVGLWGSASDYLKVLTSILRDDGKLLGSETVAEMFKPQLSPASKDDWMTLLKNPAGNAALTGNVPMGMELSWGIGGFQSLEDMPGGRRKKGSLAWIGLPNLFWWIDPEAGVAGLYASQIVPTDRKSTDLFATFEKDVYDQARAL
ncbi:beta-lactamase/transpeptidase-like protein [Athelia psychrophila]|uniref:Beta-lactamase/transpeptidase-like protein n=1 Tax=Athelia psychrophila TaxID=1759441 RepID=A0A166NL37_9AGAM|nr:beta-lactamase/transpeptidase-like protein [Fibularhizoctonia sp. CBS 109695]